MPNGCTDPRISRNILTYALGELTTAQRRRVKAHLETCIVCACHPILRCSDPHIGVLIPSLQLGEVNDEEAVSCIKHLKKCASCRGEYLRDMPLVTALRRLQETMRSLPGIEETQTDPEVQEVLRKLKSRNKSGS